ncbi:MAG: hypothetical protein KGN02_04805 [bacterium]|nr:hypothetical protein [bacterium]
MRAHSYAAALLAILIAVGRASAASSVAPADEYFGPFKESILGIRNRLLAFERDTAWDLKRHLRALDNEELAIEDWYRKYPRDPWIRDFSARLVRVYDRAREGRDRYCGRMRLIARATGRTRRR